MCTVKAVIGAWAKLPLANLSCPHPLPQSFSIYFVITHTLFPSEFPHIPLTFPSTKSPLPPNSTGPTSWRWDMTHWVILVRAD